MTEEFRKAEIRDIPAVAALYQSLVGTPGCSWSADYPTQEDVRADVSAGALLLRCDATGGIIGAAAVGTDAELSSLDCWSPARFPCELARLGVRADCQHRGLARALFRAAAEDARARGFDALRFLVSVQNPRAVRLYEACGARRVGRTNAYGLDWFCYELSL